jgi:hypothetical protein
MKVTPIFGKPMIKVNKSCGQLNLIGAQQTNDFI